MQWRTWLNWIGSCGIAAVVVLSPVTSIAATVLSCSSNLTGQVAAAGSSTLGPEDVYEFTCEVDGDVTFVLSDMDCDLNIYVLDDTCQPGAGCLEGSAASFVTTDSRP
jgi:hypothetical protein